ncbi:MAG: alpha/beta fold hydrolase, partial [Actinobacteria bacterium]|nr:alpha/beta fold hydrolase [Actinomycetota bacterium]
MKQFTDRGITIAYRDVGSGPAILFLHNGGTSSIIWRHQLEALSGRWRCVAVDLPGFGDSPRPTIPASLSDLVALTAALVDELDLAPVVAVGNCMGANIAASLADSRPDLVERVLAINPLTEASFSAGRLGVFHRMARVAEGPTTVLRSLVRKIPVTRLIAVQTLRFQLGALGRAARLHHDRELLASQRRPDQLP